MERESSAQQKSHPFTVVDVLALAYCAGSLLCLVYVLWSYVPAYASLFAGLGMRLPLLTRVVIAASNWFVRLLPFAIILGTVGSGVAFALGLWLGLTKRQVLRWVLVVIGITATAASAVAVIAMHAGVLDTVQRLQ